MARSAAPSTPTNRVFRVPLVGSFQNRSGSDATKDQRFVNCYPESKKSATTETKKIYLVKRPGIDLVRTYTAGTSRGLTYWNGYTYTAIGNALYKNATAIASLTLNGTSGHVGMEVCTSTDFGDVLFIADGTDCWIIKSDATYKKVTSTYSDRVISTAYVVGDYVVPTSKNGYYYRATKAGTTSPNPITFPILLGQTITDNGVTWECSGYYGYGYRQWQASSQYVVGDRVVPFAVSTGFVYECSVAGKSGALGGEPAWPIKLNLDVGDGPDTLRWTCIAVLDTSTPAPKNHLPYPVFMDGYIFLIAKKLDGSNSSTIYSSNTDNPLSWNQVDFVDAESYPDTLIALARQNNIVMAFGEYTTEMFNDAGSTVTVGSVLARNESIMLQFGCAAPESIMQQEKFVVLVGQSDTGGRAVWLIDGFTPRKVSDEYIERIIDNEGSAISTSRGYAVRTNGHLFYVLRLSNRTVVYDLEEQMWHDWSTASGSTHITFTGAYAADDGSGKMLLLGSSDATLYKLDNTKYKDYNNNNIIVDINTTRYDYDNMNRKFMSSFSIIGDQQSGSTISVRWSDDDYATYTSFRSPSIASRTYLTNLGSFRRRSFNIVYTDNFPYRIEGIEMEITLGNN